MAGDGNDGIDLADAHYSKTSLPFSWLTSTSKPAWRHLKPHELWAEVGANYLFMDAHVKLLKPEDVSAASSQGYTFAIK